MQNEYITWYTLKQFMNMIIGIYEPVQVNGTDYIDIPYIAGALLFLIFVYFVFKALISIIYRQ